MNVIFWHRRDLRVEDNTGLTVATKLGKVIPVFIFDQEILDELKKDDKRMTFIHHWVTELKNQYKKQGTDLIVRYGNPIAVMEKLAADYQVNFVIANKDYDPYSIERDFRMKESLNKNHVSFKTFKDHVIFEESDILNKENQPFKVFSPYAKEWRARYKQEEERKLLPKEEVTEGGFKVIDENLMIPSLESMGFEFQSDVILEIPEFKEIAYYYSSTRDYPNQKTTRLGVHLRFGTISIRQVLSVVDEGSETFINQLIWREFFQMLLFHYPNSVYNNFKQKYNGILWENSINDIERWKNGMTGIPIVDAGMRELNSTGFMHNRVRMICASFLVKNLLVDWRLGEAYFAEKLLDYEQASNVGSWQWVAGTGCDAAPYFRVFNPITQQQKFDPNFKYINKWIPELNTESYPKPMVDLKESRERVLKAYKTVLV